MVERDPNLYFGQVKKVELTPEGVERLAHEAVIQGIAAAIQVVESVDVGGDPAMEGLKSHIVQRLRTAEITSIATTHLPEEG